jgi:CBS domain containing-hemolysin-like protein
MKRNHVALTFVCTFVVILFVYYYIFIFSLNTAPITAPASKLLILLILPLPTLLARTTQAHLRRTKPRVDILRR